MAILGDERVTFTSGNGILTASVKGEIDHHNAGSVRQKIDIRMMSERPKELVLDLSGVSFMDSSGLGLILGRYARGSELGISVSVSNPTAAASKILDLAGMERLVKTVKSGKNGA